jgi:hypothetical protein
MIALELILTRSAQRRKEPEAIQVEFLIRLFRALRVFLRDLRGKNPVTL